jgi:cyclophilin family peptidyl-prolyl cis-trans isomerase
MKRTAIATFLAVLACVAGCGEQEEKDGNTAADAPSRRRVALHTTEGKIVLELLPHAAPISAANFLRYVEAGYYDGTIFHRTARADSDGYGIVQGGGIRPTGSRKPAPYPPIRNEAHNRLRNERGTVGMARTSEVNSATSQFFINTADNVGFDHRDRTPQGYGYAVFARVVEGMDVVDRINAAPAEGQTPLEPVVLTRARRVSAK